MDIVSTPISYKKKKYNPIIMGCVMLFISPLIAFPYIIYLIRHEVKGATYLMAFFAAIFAFLFPPMGDLYYHNMLYYSWENREATFLLFLQGNNKSDFLIWGISFFFYSFEIKFEFIRLIVTFIEFAFFAWVYETYVMGQTYRHKTKMMIYTLLCLGFIPLYQMLGIRHGLGVIFFSVATLNLYLRGNMKKTCLFILLSCVAHAHFIVLSIVLLVNYYFPLIKSRKIFVPLFIGAFVVGSVLVPILFGVFLPGSEVAEGYMDKTWEYGAGTNYSGKSGFGTILFRVWYFPFLLLFVFKQHNMNKRIESLIYILAIMVGLLWTFNTLSERTGKVLTMMLCIYYALYPFVMKNTSKIYAFSIFLLIFMQIYGLRLIMFYTDNNLKEIWKPVVYSIQCGYSKEWLDSNFNSEGELIIGNHWSL